MNYPWTQPAGRQETDGYPHTVQTSTTTRPIFATLSSPGNGVANTGKASSRRKPYFGDGCARQNHGSM
jgi:hypothetical protein